MDLRVIAERLTARNPDGPPGPEDRMRHTVRLLLVCLGFAVLCFTTRPGKIISDTKIDMAVNPSGFLERALHLWDPEHFGQLQNQVAGYFFPMGPFFALGDLAGLPGWVTQRLWMTLLMSAAFIGVVRLADRLGIGTPLTRIAGGLAYALAPRALALMGVLSGEFLATAMLPWVLIPLVTAAQGGNRTRCLARSAVAAALCSGVNAAATAGVLIIPVIYLLTRPRGVPRLRLLGGWLVAVAIATVSWWVPLLLLFRYGFSWLPYTESSAVITVVTSLFNSLRGTEDWVNWIFSNGEATWPVGYALSTNTLLILATAAVAGLSLVGLARRGLPERAFLLTCCLLGIVVVLAGHISVLEPPFAGTVRDFIDGPLAPLRNLRKFDPMIRLPLALGLAHLLCAMRRPTPRLVAAGLATACFAGVVIPAADHGLHPGGEFRAIPKYWHDAAGWLNRNGGRQGVLAVPGARFGEYTWGDPLDDPMQPLLRVRWATRQVTAAGSIGFTRLLDAIDQRLTAGQGSPGLNAVLSRMGVRYLLVRNDLDREDLRGAWPARIHEALEESTGIRKVADFGPAQGDWRTNDAANAFDSPYPALEIYEVRGADEVAGLVPVKDTIRMYGSPDGLLTLAETGLLKGRPMVLNDDTSPVPVTGSILTDSLRMRERHFGEIRASMSPTLTADDAGQETVGAVPDLLEDEWKPYLATAEYQGIKSIRASSSGSDADAIPGVSATGFLPYAAVDGDYRTAWQTGGWEGPLGHWVEIEFDRMIDPGPISATFVQDPYLGPPPSRVSVQTDAGRIDQDIEARTQPQQLRSPAGRTKRLRIRILGVAGRPDVKLGTRIGISEIGIPGVIAARTYRPPRVGADAAHAPGAVVLARGTTGTPGCMRGSARWVCSPLLERPNEEGYGFDHTFSSPDTGRRNLSGQAVLRDPAAIMNFSLLDPDRQAVVGSSAAVHHPASLPRSAFDGRDDTTWVASAEDRRPELYLDWGRRERIDRAEILRPPGASWKMQVEVRGDRGQLRGGWLDDKGVVRFQPMETRSVRIRFLAVQGPLQITEVKLPGVSGFGHPDDLEFALPCGYGPKLRVNGYQVHTMVSGTFGDILYGRAVTYTGCDTIGLALGDNRITATADDPFRVDSAVVDRMGDAAVGSTGAHDVQPVEVRGWGQGEREVHVVAEERSYLVVNENFNDGWRATLGDRTLTPVRLDGWRQAWVVPAKSYGAVTLTYRPDLIYRGALFGGLALLGLVALVAFVPRPAVWREPAAPWGYPSHPWAGLPVRVVPPLAAVVGLWTAGLAGAAVFTATSLVLLWGRGMLGPPRVTAPAGTGTAAEEGTG
ncbi:MAG: DUF3367 domain-containing protein, partial [Streptosporangiales bacterium]|nr:DUF3367 domain-containing protein [Streptosporangiales bacterium]